MKKDIIIFGKNSILSKNFTNYINNINKPIFISRKKTSKDDINFDLSKKLFIDDFKKISLEIEKNSNNEEKIFILFSWVGGPRICQSTEETWSKNMYIVINFIEICKIIKPSKIIFISSAGAIYPQNTKHNFNELDMTSPTSPYGQQKLLAEIILENFSKLNNISCIVLRIASAYGLDERFSEQGVINKWIYLAIKNKKLKLYNSIKSLINFISFEQISIAILAAINNNINGIFNIGSENSVSLEEIINSIKDISKKDLKLEIIKNDIRYFNIDTNKFYLKTGKIFKIILYKDIKNLYESIKISLNKKELY